MPSLRNWTLTTVTHNLGQHSPFFVCGKVCQKDPSDWQMGRHTGMVQQGSKCRTIHLCEDKGTTLP